jgi:hypothetical protein
VETSDDTDEFILSSESVADSETKPADGEFAFFDMLMGFARSKGVGFNMVVIGGDSAGGDEQTAGPFSKFLGT